MDKYTLHLIHTIMNPVHFFILGYYPEYLYTGVIFGIIIGVYA